MDDMSSMPGFRRASGPTGFVVVLLLLVALACSRQARQPTETVVAPKLLEWVEPVNPQQAQRQGLQGKVRLNLYVTDAGEVKLVRITNSSGHSVLDSAAVVYAKRLKFAPLREGSAKTGFWLSWVLSYGLDQQERFIPEEYAGEVRSLLRRADECSVAEQDQVLRQILALHKQYAKFVDEHPYFYGNDYAVPFLQPSILEQWSACWPEWPVTFVVFQDLVQRYPESTVAAEARSEMIARIRRDLRPLSKVEREQKQLSPDHREFVATMHAFLQHHSGAYADDLRNEIKRLLEGADEI